MHKRDGIRACCFGLARFRYQYIACHRYAHTKEKREKRRSSMQPPPQPCSTLTVRDVSEMCPNCVRTVFLCNIDSDGDAKRQRQKSAPSAVAAVLHFTVWHKRRHDQCSGSVEEDGFYSHTMIMYSAIDEDHFFFFFASTFLAYLHLLGLFSPSPDSSPYLCFSRFSLGRKTTLKARQDE